MKRYKIDNLPIQLLDRLADYSKMDWWYEETHYRIKEYGTCKGLYTEKSKKTVSSSQLKDLFCSMTVENLNRFTNYEKMELFKCLVLTDNADDFYIGALIESIKQSR